MAIVAEHFTPLNLTSIQFAALVAINDSPGLDATRLAALIDYDRPTRGLLVFSAISDGTQS